jgi:uncharacterized membrane protein
MLTSPEALLAILGMALVSFAIKAGGLLLASRMPQHGFAAAWLRHIPGAVMASLVAPAVVSGSAAEVVAAIVTAAVFVGTRSLLAAMTLGVATVYAMRIWLGA